MGEEEKYLKELEELKKEHTDLDNKINLWYKNTALKDELQLQIFYIQTSSLSSFS